MHTNNLLHHGGHPTLEQWDRWICMYPGCGAVLPKLFTDPEPEFLAYGADTEKTPTIDPDAPTIEGEEQNSEPSKTPGKRPRAAGSRKGAGQRA